MVKKITSIMLISLAFFGGTLINTQAFENDNNSKFYCILNEERETICFDEDGLPITTYEHDYGPL